MSRALTNTLAAAQAKRQRYPLARATVRDVRLRFAQFTMQANPYAALDSDSLGSENGVYGDQVVTPAGKVLRVITNGATTKLNRATPGTAASWGTWTDLGLALTARTQPGLVVVGGTIYLFYVKSTGFLFWKSSADDGVTWGAENAMSIAFVAGATIAPISNTLIYVCYEQGTGANCQLGIDRISFSAGTWHLGLYPGFIFGNNAADAAWVSSGHTYFDAFTLGGADYLILSDASRGLGWAVQYQSGAWATPRWLLPDDYTAFRPYRVSVIQGRAWLTGRLVRSNASGWSPALDVYLYSDDGQNWTALARDSYLGLDEVRGKLHLPGDGYVYYAGIYRVQRAPASYLIDPAGDLSANKLVLTDDLASAEVDYSATGMAPEASIELASGHNDYFEGGVSAGIVAPGSNVDIELGYKTTAGNEYLLLFKGNIDGPELALGDGERSVTFTARDAGYKQLKDWSSALYWELLSQRKKHDDCDNMNNLALDSGTWTTGGPNLIADPSWEYGTNPWADYVTGLAGGTRARSKDDASTGKWSWKMVKASGGDGDRFGSSITFAALAGKTYAVSLDVRCSDISGGGISYTLSASGNYGAAGAAVTVTTSLTDSLSVFQTMTVSVVCVTSATVTVAAYFDNATAGTLLIDNAVVQDTAPGYLSTSEQDAEQVLVSPDDAIDDFDIRAQYYDLATSPAAGIGLGLIGLFQDHDNYLLLQLAAGNKLQLYKKRAGAWIVLGNVTYAWNRDGTPYRIRLVHRAGHFWGYATTAASGDWGAPLIDYTWDSLTDKPCNTDNGRGKVGVRARIQPLRFHAYGLDEFSTVVCLRANNDLNWNSLASSGDLLWEGERISYTGKTGAGVIVPLSLQWTQDCVWHAASGGGTTDGYWDNANSAHFGQAPYHWPWYVQTAVVGGFGDGGLDHYGLMSPNGLEPYSAWHITDFVDNYGGHSFLTTDASGHANTNNQASGGPNWHGLGVVDLVAAPCLYGGTRGVGNTTAIRHTDNTIAFQFADDAIYLDFFESYDGNEDWSNGRALARMCAMAGVMSIQSDNRGSGQAYAGTTSGLWSQFAQTDWSTAAFSLTDFELSLHSAALADGEGVGIGFWGSLFLTLEYVAATGYWARLYTGAPGGALLEGYRLPMQPDIGAALDLRFVIKGRFLTYTLNGMPAGQFYTTVAPAVAGLIVTVKGAAYALSLITVPDLGEWREFAQVNEGESAQDSVVRLLEDRPIYQTSRVGVPKFSTFEQRAALGTFADDFFTDQSQAQDTEIFTWPRVEAEEIMEEIEDALARQYGLIHKRLSMQTATTAAAARMLAALVRRMQGTAFVRSQGVAGLLDWEPEDTFIAAFTTAGALTAVNKDLIVNDVKYMFNPGELLMSVTARRHV